MGSASYLLMPGRSSPRGFAVRAEGVGCSGATEHNGELGIMFRCYSDPYVNAAGRLTRSDKPWNTTQVWRVLQYT
jgi:hypothetical protein